MRPLASQVSRSYETIYNDADCSDDDADEDNDDDDNDDDTDDDDAHGAW